MTVAALEWTKAEDQRLKTLLLAMFPYAKIMAEFRDYEANAVRDAWHRAIRLEGRTPLERALLILGERARFCRVSPTGLRLDGRPSSAAAIVGEANELLRERGLPEIAYLGRGNEIS